MWLEFAPVGNDRFIADLELRLGHIESMPGALAAEDGYPTS